MKIRVAKIDFNLLVLQNNFDVRDLATIFDDLPDDTILYSFGGDYSTGVLSMVFQSPAFKEIDEYGLLSKIEVFKDIVTGDITLDMTNVLDPVTSNSPSLTNLVYPNPLTRSSYVPIPPLPTPTPYKKYCVHEYIMLAISEVCKHCGEKRNP